MRCTNCECTEFYKIGSVGKITEECYGSGYGTDSHKRVVTTPRALIKYSFSTSGDTQASLSLNSGFEAYLCKNCGHIELFAKGTLKSIQLSEEQLKNQIKEKESSNKALLDELKNYEKEKDKFEKRLDELIESLESEDITIKQQKEYSEEKDKIQLRLMMIDKQYTVIKQQIDPEIEELEELKERLKQVGTIASVDKQPWY